MSEGDIRKRILREATRLFGQKGFGSTSVRELASACDVTKPTLYYHFGSKQGLYLAAIEMHLQALDGLVQQALVAPGTVRNRLEWFVEQYLTRAQESPDSVRFLMTANRREEDDKPVVDLAGQHMRKIALLVPLIEEGKRSGELRSEFESQEALFALVGMVNLWVAASNQGQPVPNGIARRLVRLFYEGMQAQ